MTKSINPVQGRRKHGRKGKRQKIKGKKEQPTCNFIVSASSEQAFLSFAFIPHPFAFILSLCYIAPMSLPILETAPWLAQTKLHPPRLRAGSVPRRRLSDWLAATAVSTPVTLISAPAGYGKTTLCATLSQTRPDLPLAWLSLDEDDNDISAFMAALIGSLQVIEPAFGAAAQRLLPTLASLSEQENGRSEIRRFMGVAAQRRGRRPARRLRAGAG
jgi:hypothetical protein